VPREDLGQLSGSPIGAAFRIVRPGLQSRQALPYLEPELPFQPLVSPFGLLLLAHGVVYRRAQERVSAAHAQETGELRLVYRPWQATQQGDSYRRKIFLFRLAVALRHRSQLRILVRTLDCDGHHVRSPSLERWT
jgi:hypothetical protein